MDAILLHRIDAAKNMRRFYRLEVAPDLFGRWCLVAEWGRIGRSGRLRMAAYESAAEAWEALARQRHAKERRGYVSPVIGEPFDRTEAKPGIVNDLLTIEASTRR